MLHHHIRTVAQNRRSKTLALETAFGIFMATDGHRSFSYMFRKGEIFSCFGFCNLPRRCHLIPHTAPLTPGEFVFLSEVEKTGHVTAS